MADVVEPTQPQATGDTVAQVARELQEGTIDVDAAEVRLQAITASSRVKPPAKTGDQAFQDSVTDDWMAPSNDNDPSKLFLAGIKDAKTFQRLYTALVGPEPGAEELPVTSG